MQLFVVRLRETFTSRLSSEQIAGLVIQQDPVKVKHMSSLHHRGHEHDRQDSDSDSKPPSVLPPGFLLSVVRGSEHVHEKFIIYVCNQSEQKQWHLQ